MDDYDASDSQRLLNDTLVLSDAAMTLSAVS
jgi:hypothetical protein